MRVRPSLCMHHPSQLDRFTVCSALSECELTLPTPPTENNSDFDQGNLLPLGFPSTQIQIQYTNLYMYSESTNSLSFSLRELDSPDMIPWIPHNTICWLINNSGLSVSRHVWIQSHLHLPRPPLNKLGVLSLSWAPLISVWACVCWLVGFS